MSAGKLATPANGMAISKAHMGSTRFSPKVKEYLTAKFLIGERTGRKADPSQVERDMGAARNQSNERQFSCTECLVNEIPNTKLRL